MKKVPLFIISIVLFGCITSIFATTPTVNKKMVGSSKQKTTTVSGEASFGNLPKKGNSVAQKDSNVSSGMTMSGKITTLKERLEELKAKKIKKDAYLKVTAEKMKILQDKMIKKEVDLKTKQKKNTVESLNNAVMPKGSSLTVEQEKELGGILRLIKKNLTEEERILVKVSVDNWWKSLENFLHPSDWQIIGTKEQVGQLSPSEYKKYLIDSKDERMKMIVEIKELLKDSLIQRNLILGKEVPHDAKWQEERRKDKEMIKIIKEEQESMKENLPTTEVESQMRAQNKNMKDAKTQKEDVEIFDTSKGSTYSFVRQDLTEEEKVRFKNFLIAGYDISSRFDDTDVGYDNEQLILITKVARKSMIYSLINLGFIQEGKETEFEKVANKKTEKIINDIIRNRK